MIYTLSLTHASFLELNEKLKTHIECYNKNILAKKEIKFLRDKQAFHEGRAYKWHQQRTEHTNINRHIMTINQNFLTLLLLPPNHHNLSLRVPYAQERLKDT